MIRFRSVLLADLDGTLAPVHAPVPMEGIRALETAVRRGALVVVVTGASLAGVGKRLLARAAPSIRGAFIVYANNGGCCIAVRPDGSRYGLYDHSAEFSAVRTRVVTVAANQTRKAGLGEIKLAPGSEASRGTVCVEHKESQVTLTLLGMEAARAQLVTDLSRILKAEFGDKLQVRGAGRKSIDILLSKDSKANAIRHFIDNRATFGCAPNADTVIVGDSFGPGGADNEMLHEALSGATVFSAGTMAPAADGFTVLHAQDPSPYATIRFLSDYFGERSGTRASPSVLPEAQGSARLP